ncbi:MAG: (4Fe-4S)-binding protein [Thermoanaerobaculia bacterium]
MAKRTQKYSTDEITVTFDPNTCIHSAVCLRSLPGVFDVARKRWIRLENASAKQVAATVAACPSGALESAGRESREP